MKSAETFRKYEGEMYLGGETWALSVNYSRISAAVGFGELFLDYF
jgi:hypothetical protein